MAIAGQSNTLVYGFDAANRLISLTQGSVAVGWSYDAANRFTGVTLPNGISSVVTPDAAKEISSIAYSKGSTATANVAYTYDGDGNRSGASGTMVRPLLDAGLSGTTYDAGNHLTALSTGALAYDADGNLLTQAGAGPASYTWNDRSQLTGTSNGTVLAYDALGRLVGRTQSGATTAFLYDGTNQVTVNGNVMLRGASLDEVETQVTSSGTINYLTDGLGSTSMLTDSTGNVTTLYSYGAYGATATTGSSGAATVDTPFKYTGADYNSVDDLYYFRNRYYSPHLQRFISEDPIGLGGEINMNAYVGDNPISLADPSGLCPVDCNTVLPNGRTVGSYVRQYRAQLQSVADAEGADDQQFGATTAAFAAIVPSYGPIDFKNIFRGKANGATLGLAGNFAYYAIGAGILPDRELDAGAGGYALYSALRGRKPWSSLTGPMFSDASAAAVRAAALSANGCN